MVKLEPNVDETLKLVVELVQTTCTLAMGYMEAQRNNQSRQAVEECTWPPIGSCYKVNFSIKKLQNNRWCGLKVQ